MIPNALKVPPIHLPERKQIWSSVSSMGHASSCWAMRWDHQYQYLWLMQIRRTINENLDFAIFLPHA